MGKAFIFILCTYAGISTWAQLPRFDSVWVSPPQPVAGQDVGFLYRTTFPAANCHLVNYSLNQNMNSLTLHLYHFQGMLTMICHSEDSIYPGTYPAGTYQLMALLYYQGDTIPHDTAIISFAVAPLTGHEDVFNTPLTPDFPLPNPVRAGSELAIPGAETMEWLEVRDLQGRIVTTVSSAGARQSFTISPQWKGQIFVISIKMKDLPHPLTRKLCVW